jgi:hypothetical protein
MQRLLWAIERYHQIVTSPKAVSIRSASGF